MLSSENTTIDDSLISLGVKYRGRIMRELQDFYRRKGTEEECAKRIGELMGIVVVLQVHSFIISREEQIILFEDLSFIMPMNLEMFRLLNVFDDNTTMYQLTKNGIPEVSRMNSDDESVYAEVDTIISLHT